MHENSFSAHGVETNIVSMSLHSCLQDEPLNHSTHDLLGFTVTLPISGTKTQENSTAQNIPIPVWSTLDTELYHFNLEKNLSEIFNNFSEPETLPILAGLIPSSFIDAAKSSAEFKTAKQPKNFKKNKSKDKWKAELLARKFSEIGMFQC